MRVLSQWPFLFVLRVFVYRLFFLFLMCLAPVQASWFDGVFGVSSRTASADSVRPMIGWVEQVTLPEAGFVMKARIDTGAGLASVHAEVMEVVAAFEGSAERVTFRLRDQEGHEKVLTRPVVKWINIKKKGGRGFTRRPVVKLRFCLGGKRVVARVNLADRTDFLYPLLIGRNVLKAGDYLIDPERTFTHAPSCP